MTSSWQRFCEAVFANSRSHEFWKFAEMRKTFSSISNMGEVIAVIFSDRNYHQVYNIRRTKSHNLNVSRPALQSLSRNIYSSKVLSR